MRQAFLYAIGPTTLESPPVIKIGWSRKPEQRLGQLQRQFRDPLDLLYRAAVEEVIRAERRCHEQLAEHRVSGEWFRVTLAQAQAAITAAIGSPMPPYMHSMTFGLTEPTYVRLQNLLAEPSDYEADFGVWREGEAVRRQVVLAWERKCSSDGGMVGPAVPGTRKS